MEKELLNSDKELLLQDLCARLPYGVFMQLNNKSAYRPAKLVSIDVEKQLYNIGTIHEVPFNFAKPCLFPLSSMTEEQKAELSMLVVGVGDIFKSFLIEVEFYHKHHIDYRGLIPMGLAIDATNLNIY